jgi:X-X-X-Leu-X-X-Gly heptad repeat protein
MIKSELAKADIGSDIYNSLTKNLRDMSFLTTTVQDAIKLGLEIPQDVVEQMYEQVFDQNNLPTDMYVGMIQKFIDDFKEKTGKDLQVGANGSLSEQKPEKQGKEEDDFKKFNDGIGKLTGGLSQVSSGLKAVGVEIPKEVDDVIGVISGVSQIISGVGSIISLFSTTAITANTAAVVANTAALGVNTATNFIPFFAGGGIVPHAANGYFVGGNKFSGDTTPIMANAGELVLNKAQQGNLAAQLEGSPVGGTDTQPYLDGEKIFLGLQAYTRRSGLGEIVTSER